MPRSQQPIRAPLSAAAMLVAITCSPLHALAQATAPTPVENGPSGSAPSGFAVDPERAPDRGPEAAAARWYGWQTLVADLVGVALVGAGIFVGANGSGGGAIALIGLGMADLWIAPPAIHLVHHNRWALGSLLIRTAAVGLVIGGTVGTAACLGGPCSGGQVVLVIGLATLLGATVTDAILARERDEAPRVSLAPWGDPHARAAGLNVAAAW